jgi:hypothetical protein
MDNKKNISEFSQNELDMIQEQFYKLIIERAKTGWNCKEFLEDKTKKLPVITNKLQTESEWFPVPGMYGGFKFELINKNNKPVLISESWSRVVGGSGQRHEITTEGYTLLEEGFV